MALTYMRSSIIRCLFYTNLKTKISNGTEFASPLLWIDIKPEGGKQNV